MKQVVYYSDYMKEKQHEKKISKFRRICIYTLVAVLSMQGAQMYSMASFAELFQKSTNMKVNAFVPKKYTNVEIEEPNGQTYTMDENGKVYVKGDSGKTKQAYFTNPIDNVTYEYIRARIVAVVKYVDGNDVEGVNVEYDESTINTDGKWVKQGEYYYYKKPLEPGGSTSKFFSEVTIQSPDKKTLEGKGQYIEFNVIVDTIETDEKGDTTKANTAWKVDLDDILK